MNLPGTMIMRAIGKADKIRFHYERNCVILSIVCCLPARTRIMEIS